MKQIAFTLLIASAIISFGLGSCNKETTAPPITPPQPQPFSLDLIADNWTKTCDPQFIHYGECSSDHKMYISDLQDVLNSSNLSCACTIKVYVVTNGKEI